MNENKQHINCETSKNETSVNHIESGCCSHDDEHNHSADDGHNHDVNNGGFKIFLPAIISLVLLLIALGFDHYFPQSWFSGYTRIGWYVLAYLPVGIPVIKEAFESMVKGDVFSEFFLMCIATIGAFAIGEYPEGVAVMLFYTIGEVFQTMAVSKAKSNIKSLLDQRPDEVTLLENNEPRVLKAANVPI